MKVYWIDLFCGAGGTTTGIHLSNVNSEVLACVNHDGIANIKKTGSARKISWI